MEQGRRGRQRVSKWEWERYRDEKSVGFQIQSLDISGVGRPWAGLTAICHLRLACQHTLTAATMPHFLRQESQHEEAKPGGQHWKSRPKIKVWTLPGPDSYCYTVSNDTFDLMPAIIWILHNTDSKLNDMMLYVAMWYEWSEEYMVFREACNFSKLPKIWTKTDHVTSSQHIFSQTPF